MDLLRTTANLSLILVLILLFHPSICSPLMYPSARSSSSSSSSYYSSIPLLPVTSSRHRYPKGTVLQEDPLVFQLKRITQSAQKFSNRFFNAISEHERDEMMQQQTDDTTEGSPLSHPSSSPPPRNNIDMVYSPLTVFTSLATLRSGSTGDTFHELSNLLSLAKVNESVLEQGMGLVLESLSHPNEKGSVNLINRLFLDTQLQPRNSFINRLTDKFYGELLQTPFSNAASASRTVNDNMFISSHGILHDVLAVEGVNEEEGEVQDDAAAATAVTTSSASNSSSNNITTTTTPQPLAIDGGLMLVSGFTFTADWERSFTPLLTRPEPFYREDGTKSTAMMMHRDGIYFMAEILELNATALSIPYKGFRYSFTLLLPVEGTTTAMLSENLINFPFLAVLSRLKKQHVQLSLPRFEVDTTMDLVEPLERMGISRVFSEDTAELGRLVNEDSSNYVDLFLTNAVTKTVLDVSEGGSRVPSANFIEAVPAKARHLTPLVVNRPFLFFITDQLLNSVLLVGRKAL